MNRFSSDILRPVVSQISRHPVVRFSFNNGARSFVSSRIAMPCAYNLGKQCWLVSRRFSSATLAEQNSHSTPDRSSIPHSSAALSAPSQMFQVMQNVTSSIVRVNGVSGARRTREELLKFPLSLDVNLASSSFIVTVPPGFLSSWVSDRLLADAQSPFIEWSCTSASQLTGQFVSPVPRSQWTGLEESIKAFVEYSRLPVNLVVDGSGPRTINPCEGSSTKFDNVTPLSLSPSLVALLPQDRKSILNSDAVQVQEFPCCLICDSRLHRFFAEQEVLQLFLHLPYSSPKYCPPTEAARRCSVL